MDNPWLSLPKTAPFVLDCDKRDCEEAGLKRSVFLIGNALHSLMLDCKLCRDPTCHTKLSTLEKLAEALDVPCEMPMEIVRDTRGTSYERMQAK